MPACRGAPRGGGEGACTHAHARTQAHAHTQARRPTHTPSATYRRPACGLAVRPAGLPGGREAGAWLLRVAAAQAPEAAGGAGMNRLKEGGGPAVESVDAAPEERLGVHLHLRAPRAVARRGREPPRDPEAHASPPLGRRQGPALPSQEPRPGRALPEQPVLGEPHGGSSTL